MAVSSGAESLEAPCVTSARAPRSSTRVLTGRCAPPSSPDRGAEALHLGLVPPGQADRALGDVAAQQPVHEVREP
jgi:hypothetical protein